MKCYDLCAQINAPITPVVNAPSIAYHSLFIDFCLSRPSRNDIPTQPMISLSSSRYY